MLLSSGNIIALKYFLFSWIELSVIDLFWSPFVHRFSVCLSTFTFLTSSPEPLGKFGMKGVQVYSNETSGQFQSNLVQTSCIWIQVYSNENPSPLQRGDNYKSAKNKVGSIKHFLLMNPHCGTWVPVFRMRPDKPRSRVAVGVARQRSLPAQWPWAPSIGLNLQPCRRQWWQSPDSWKIAQGTRNKTNDVSI